MCAQPGMGRSPPGVQKTPLRASWRVLVCPLAGKEPSLSAEQATGGKLDRSARGGAGRPTGGPMGLPGCPSKPDACSPIEGGGEPRASPDQGAALPSSAAAGHTRWPLSVRVDGHRIETVTATVEYLKAKHGGRCTLERKGKFWLLKRRGEEIAWLHRARGRGRSGAPTGPTSGHRTGAGRGFGVGSFRARVGAWRARRSRERRDTALSLDT